MTNPAASWLSPRTRVAPSGIEGRGLFASEAIPAGEVVAVKGGAVFGRAELARIAPLLREEDREGSMIFSNHSCDPNIGVRGQIVFVTLRDVAAGEELTHDWAMTDDDEGRMECRCGSSICRGVVTGKDWQKPELQQRYGPFMSAYLQEKIARSRTIRSLP